MQGELREYLRRQQLSDIADTSSVDVRSAEEVTENSSTTGELLNLQTPSSFTPEPMYVSSSGGSTTSSEGVSASPPPSSTLQGPPIPPRSFEMTNGSSRSTLIE